MEAADGGSRCRDWSVNVLYQALSESSFVTLALAIGWRHIGSNPTRIKGYFLKGAVLSVRI